jgi:translation initiation factor 2B subunit (eIF-2B alpha/beta/delta family)
MAFSKAALTAIEASSLAACTKAICYSVVLCTRKYKASAVNMANNNKVPSKAKPLDLILEDAT